MTTPSTDLRSELIEWLDGAWNPDLSLVEWRERLVEGRWSAVSWPTDWFGRGLDAPAEQLVARELADRDIPGAPMGAGRRLAGPTLLAHATAEQKHELLPAILTGRHRWCQLFSEPGSGSDLAGLTTRAEPDGNVFRVTGQKLWSTSADHADFGMLLCRTDWDVPKHRGISYFALPMNQQGVHVRPLHQMNGHASFNEIFLDDAVVPRSMLIGDLNAGWSVAKTTLSNERRLADHRTAALPAGEGRARYEAAQEMREYTKTYSWYPQRGGRPDIALEHARVRRLCDDAVARQWLARLYTEEQVAAWTAQRLRPLGGAHGSLSKLASSDVARCAAHVHSYLAGAQALLWERGIDDSLEAVVAEVILSVPAVSIAGGTDEIQRDIVAERLLGLPKEPNNSHRVPFREVRRN